MIQVTLRQMQYFDALTQTLHFGRAAAMAGVSQPALSAQIAELEERLGCRLFERGGRSVSLTQDAEALRPRIERVLAEVREIEAVAGRGRRPLEGRFRLGIIPTVAPYLLPQALPSLKERFPAMRIELREAVTATLVDETVRGRLDAFIAALPLEEAGLSSAELFVDRFFLAVPADDPGFAAPPVPPGSPALERLILLEEGHCMRDQALAVCGSVRPAAFSSYGATSLTTLLQMVAHGLGVTLIPEMAVPGATPGGLKVVPFCEPMPQRLIGLFWRRGSARDEECRRFADAIGDMRRRSPP